VYQIPSSIPPAPRPSVPAGFLATERPLRLNSERPPASLPGLAEPEAVEAGAEPLAEPVYVSAAASLRPTAPDPRERPASMRGVVGSSSALVEPLTCLRAPTP